MNDKLPGFKKKIKIYHFHNGSGGGVLSVIRNLVKYRQHDEIENHIIYTINQKTLRNFEVPEIEGIKSAQIFYFSPLWNYYYTFKRLSQMLPDEKAVIVAHDWMELGMVSNLGLQNPVVYFLHGNFDYYYNLAFKHNDAIEKFIPVSEVIEKKLTDYINRRSDIKFLRFPIPTINFSKRENKTLKIIFFVRNLKEERKQFSLLPKIAEIVSSKSVTVNWIIAGGGLTGSELEKLWVNPVSNVEFFGELSNEEIIKLLPQCDIFILPSLSEGLPVSVVEAMKAGLVPLITDWEGATKNIVIEGDTGFYFKVGDASAYSKKIIELDEDRSLLKTLSTSAFKKANCLFDPIKNTFDIEQFFLQAKMSTNIKKAIKTYGSRLDKAWIPNLIVSALRRIYSKR